MARNTLTKRDFEELGTRIHSLIDNIDPDSLDGFDPWDVARELANFCEARNDSFDRVRFFEACGFTKTSEGWGIDMDNVRLTRNISMGLDRGEDDGPVNTEQSPSYRSAMTDAGRGHLLR